MNKQQLFEATKIINEVGTTWKVKRALLKYKLNLPEALIIQLVPEPPQGKDFHACDL